VANCLLYWNRAISDQRLGPELSTNSGRHNMESSSKFSINNDEDSKRLSTAMERFYSG
jgi:hypothetical protein